jgi:hypothetical protein
MINHIYEQFIDYIVSKFFCPDLDAIKTKCYYFDGSVYTNVISRHHLESIYLNENDSNTDESTDLSDSDNDDCTQVNLDNIDFNYISDSDEIDDDEDPKNH